MKRHMNLIRAVLEYVECHGDSEFLAPPEVDGYSPGEIEYHIQLCEQAGYLETRQAYPRTLTWDGHNALDKLRGARIG